MTAHTAIFSGATGCGKTEQVLSLLQTAYRGYFENIVIICPTLRWNKAYLGTPWIWEDSSVFCIEPGDRLFKWLKVLSHIFNGEQTLFIVDDMISDQALDKKRQPLLGLATSGRHKGYSLWLLTQSYTAIPKNLRRQKKQLFLWYPPEKSDLKLVDEETNVIPPDQMESIKEQLQSGEHTCLYVRLSYPRAFEIING